VRGPGSGLFRLSSPSPRTAVRGTPTPRTAVRGLGCDTLFHKDRPMTAPEVYSPGLEGVLAGETAISTVAGGLRYRGYPVTELAEHTSFDEVAYLLLHGDLPTTRQLAEFHKRVAGARSLPGPLFALLKPLPRA